MRYILFLFCFLAFAQAEDYSFTTDKKKHLAISALFGFASETVLESYNQYSLAREERFNGLELILYSTAIGVVPGVLKEAMDSQEEGNRWSNVDLAYDAAGSFTGSLLSYGLHRLFDTDVYSIQLSLQKQRQELYLSYRF